MKFLDPAREPSRQDPEATAPALSRRHLTALDGLRGIAILAVIFHHLAGSCWPSSHPYVHGLKNLLLAGWAGVDLFFVLSGFLITGILMDTKSAENYFQAFYVRRALRIFPVFYLVLTALTLIHYSPLRWVLAPVFPPDGELPFYYLYLNNLLPLDRNQPNILGHFWSLAVEEQFYLFWPLCVWLLPRRTILPVAAGGCFVGLCLRFGLLLDCRFLLHRPPPDFLNTLPFRGLDTLVAGAAIAALVRSPRLLFRFRKLIYVSGALSGIVVFAMLFHNQPGPVLTRSGQVFNLIGYTLLGLAFGAVILSIFETEDQPSLFQLILRSPPLTSLGKYSYGIYIYHVPVLVIGLVLLSERIPIRISATTSLIFMLSVVGISYCVAMLSYKLFESRILSLKSQFVARHK